MVTISTHSHLRLLLIIGIGLIAIGTAATLSCDPAENSERNPGAGATDSHRAPAGDGPADHSASRDTGRQLDDATLYRQARAACDHPETLPRPQQLRTLGTDCKFPGSNDPAVYVTTWSSWPEYKRMNKPTVQQDVWVTVSTDLRNRLKQRSNAVEKRVAEILGMPHDASHRFFAYMVVRRRDLFRPAFNPDISDGEVLTEYPPDVPDDHREWLDATIKARADKGEPFTALGYTYDWGHLRDRHTDSPIGPTEFVIRSGSSVFVVSREYTDIYLLRASGRIR